MSTTRFLVAALSALVGCTAGAATTEQEVAREADALAAAKLIIEHNATDADTGFQGFVDGEPWTELVIAGPTGRALSVRAQAGLGDIGLTELFFETDEPANDEVPIADMLAHLPAGKYTFRGKGPDGETQTGVAELSHAIPAAPIITAPAPDAIVSADADLHFQWSAVTETINCETASITHYQLIVSKAEQPEHRGFGSETLSLHVPAATTAMRVPHEFLEAHSEYEYEVLAIDASGNQTIAAGAFSTR